ncbi:hypothetical protein [Streptomyces sp. Cmuel-A718b]|uniref:hypothetical protein n=1 Tax=Streptomyces sp. Cmuel-A718b TaxID=697328 RepID=UPI00081DCD33|nr:hypothetical protein [Streptomyces sp. Cmuel-A718b]SCF65834.1 hypothetical protein GA0115280_105219 [Streptomyces sp. Cmuel-A718b]
MFYPGSESELVAGMSEAGLAGHQRLLIQATLRAMHPGAYATQHAAAGGAAVLSLSRAEAVLRSRAGASDSKDAQPNEKLAYTVIERTLKSVLALEAVVIPAKQPLADIHNLLADMVLRGRNDLKEPSRCGVLAHQLAAFVPKIERIVLDLFQQAWDTAMPVTAAERAIAEVASLAVWRGRDYECLVADLQRFLRKAPCGQGLLSVLRPAHRQIRVAAVVEGARTLAGLGQLFDADTNVRQFPIGKKAPDGWGQGTAKLRKFAALHGRHPGEDPREGERAAAAVLLTLSVMAPDRGVAVHLARRRIEEALDTYVAGHRLAELRLAPETLVFEESDDRSRRYTSRGPTVDTAWPLTRHWPAEIRECLRMAHIARSTSSPLTSAALSWAAIEAAGIRHGYNDSAAHVELARALSLQAMRQQLLSSHQCVRRVASAIHGEVTERAAGAGRAVEGLERHLAKKGAQSALEQQLREARGRAATAELEAADADNLYLQPLNEIDRAVPVKGHGLLSDLNRWADLLAEPPGAAQEVKIGSAALSRLRTVLHGLPAHDIDVWRARMSSPKQCAAWLRDAEERCRAQLSWMYVLRNTALHQGVFASVADSHDAHGARGTLDLTLEVLGNWYAVASSAQLPEATWSAHRVITELAKRQQDVIRHLEADAAVVDLQFTHLTSPTSNGHDRL